MKKTILFLVAAAAAIVSCSRAADVPFVQMDNYFFRNDATAPAGAKVSTQADFESMFGMAAFMGKDGQPTPVDFDKEFVIAVVGEETDVATGYSAESLVDENGTLVFTFKETVGDRQGWTMRPVLLVKVDRQYEALPVRLERILVE